MASKHDLMKRRQEAIESARRVLDGKSDHESLTRSERKAFDRHWREVKRCDRELGKLEPTTTPVGRGAFANRSRDSDGNGRRKMGKEDREALSRFIRTGDGGEQRAASQSIGSKNLGGALASTGLLPELQEIMKRHGGVRRTRARIITTSHGRAFNVPGLDDTNNEASIVAEGSTIGSVSALNFSDVQFTAHTYQAGPILLSREQLQDSELDVAQIVMDSLGRRIARATESAYAGSTATSSTAPNGLVTLSTGAVSMAAGSSNLSLQLLRNLFFSVDPAYRSEAEWGVSDSALQALSDLEDADGRPLIEPDVRAGLEGTIFGRPLHVIQGLGDIESSSQIPILFGDYNRGFAIRDVSEIQIQRLDERYAEQRRIGFLGWFRTDSKGLFSSTIAAANRPLRGIKTT